MDRGCLIASALRTVEAHHREMVDLLVKVVTQHVTDESYCSPPILLPAALEAVLLDVCTRHEFISHEDARRNLVKARTAAQDRLQFGPERVEQWALCANPTCPFEEHRSICKERLRLMAELLTSVFFDAYLGGIEDLANQRRLFIRANRASDIIGIREEIRSKEGVLRECAIRLCRGCGIDDLKGCELWRSLSRDIQSIESLNERRAEAMLETAASNAGIAMRNAIEAQCPAVFYVAYGYQMFRDSLLDQLTAQVIREWSTQIH